MNILNWIALLLVVIWFMMPNVSTYGLSQDDHDHDQIDSDLVNIFLEIMPLMLPAAAVAVLNYIPHNPPIIQQCLKWEEHHESTKLHRGYSKGHVGRLGFYKLFYEL